MESTYRTDGWQLSKTDVFWGEIAPCDHVLQIYENNDAFLEVLAGYVGGGINAGDSVVVIATQEHLAALRSRMQQHGIFVDSLIDEDRYIPLVAEEVLAKFMVNGWPDEALFTKAVSRIIKHARGKDRKVRAFGEMVALLWAQGHSGATVQLEHLWNKYCEKEELTLFCAYPKVGFTQDAGESLRHICGSHTKIISGTDKPLTEILYQEIPKKEAV
jgi:hypothetical protein